MANTSRYAQLSKRVAAIENYYVPVVKASGNYSKKEQDDLRAFLFLVHAEIESYFEEVSENKAKSAFNKWKERRTKSNVLLALVTFCASSLSDLELENRINKALSLYINKLRSNHGIKERNIVDILLPIGIEHSTIDPTWLVTMTDFGKKRGVVAHSTAIVQQPLDPVTLKATIHLILAEIKKIDEIILKIK